VANDLLTGLDLVDWAHIRSTGLDNSLEAPILLRRLADEVDGISDGWAGRLQGLVIHEHSGCTVQAAEYVAPFLVRLCSSDRPAVARASVDLLCEMVVEPFHAEVENGNGDMNERILSTIQAGRGAYVRMLSGPDRRTRQAAAELLSLLDAA
jgi:hypothetical protein